MVSISWLWTPKDHSGTAPALGDQYVAMGRQVLCLRNPWVADSAFMGKMYAVSLVATFIFFLFNMNPPSLSSIIAASIFLLIISSLIFYRVYFIKRQSNFCFNRKTQKVYFRKGKLLHVGDWSQVKAGVCVRNEFNVNSVSTIYSLILNVFGTDPESEQAKRIARCWMPTYCICIDSNEPSDPRPLFIAQAWEYIRQFMAQGPDKLPMPQEPHWWHVPHNNICLTPAQAFRHYAPWRTGEPGERQGKKWWLMPLWVALFPYNLFAALCWWGTCRLLRVRAVDPPPEAMEGETGPLITLDMAAQGLRP